MAREITSSSSGLIVPSARFSSGDIFLLDDCSTASIISGGRRHHNVAEILSYPTSPQRYGPQVLISREGAITSAHLIPSRDISTSWRSGFLQSLEFMRYVNCKTI